MTKQQLDLLLKYVDDSIRLMALTNPYGYDAASRRREELREQLERTVEVQKNS